MTVDEAPPMNPGDIALAGAFLWDPNPRTLSACLGLPEYEATGVLSGLSFVQPEVGGFLVAEEFSSMFGDVIADLVVKFTPVAVRKSWFADVPDPSQVRRVALAMVLDTLSSLAGRRTRHGIRQLSVEYFLPRHPGDGRVDVVLTCDGCPSNCECEWAFDGYNTDGDCIMLK